MPELSVISCIDAVKAFERAGWQVKRSGTHVVMTKLGSMASLSIPNHHEIARGTLRKLIRLAGLNVEEFIKCLS